MLLDGALIPARPRLAVDVTGCGDMVLAALGVCVAAGMDWQEACTVANAAAGLKVERRGAVPVSRAEVVCDLAQAQGKEVTAELLPAIREASKARGRRVVFSNGCFDLLHAGHVQSLQEARRQGDVLVIGVNSDESVRHLKGPGRPIRPLTERLGVLAALDCVDWVVPFDGPTSIELICSLRPDVLAKGADTPCPVGGDFVRSYGGRVHLTGMLPNISTTGIVARCSELSETIEK
jgi:D-beta-D-heptose 7-phosphate kinase/D-beta-D-heptose 1-phosphate adenosyltransferase